MRILLTQPQKQARRLFAHFLHNQGHDVVEAGDAAGAQLALDSESPFQLILLDRQLPDMDGLLLVRTLRAHSGSQDSYIVMFSGSDEDRVLAAIVRSGADDYMVLPASLDRVQTRIQVALTQAERLMPRETARDGTQQSTHCVQFDDFFESMPDGAFILNTNGLLVGVNTRLADLAGYGAFELAGQPGEYIGLPSVEDLPPVPVLPGGGLDTIASRAVEAMLIRRDMKSVRVQLRTSWMMVDGEPCLVGIIRPEATAEPVLEVLDSVREPEECMVIGFGRQGAIRSMSSAFAGMLGFDRSGLVGQNIRSLIHAEDLSILKTIMKNGVLASPTDSSVRPVRWRRGDGSWLALDIVDGNRVQSDATMEFQLLVRPRLEAGSENECKPAASRSESGEVRSDRLTNLMDRDAFLETLNEAYRQSDIERCPITVLFIDLDRFKLINESLGYEVGDHLLIQVGERICQHSGQMNEVARVAGDEFVVLARDIHDEASAVSFAERILDDFRSAAFDLDGHEVFVTLSIGVALSSARTSTSVDLMRNADIARTRAKRNGRSRYVLFSDDMRLHGTTRLRLETDIQRARERDELRIHYQPEVDLVNGAICGIEALVRWEHPRRGLIAPGSFLGPAEETGVIDGIGFWMLEEACKQAASWLQAFELPENFSVSVNFSASQFRRKNVVADVGRVLKRTGLPAQNLRIEITENVVMDDDPQIIKMLHRLKALGIRLAIDDFGTGYASLSYLRSLPADTLKIDRSFVSGVGTEAELVAITRSVASLAHDVGMEVIVEGIETIEQLRRVRAFDCRRGQGYFFSRPVDASTLEFLLAAGARPFSSLVGKSRTQIESESGAIAGSKHTHSTMFPSGSST